MEIRMLEEQPALTIRTNTPLKDLQKIIGEAYGEIAQYLGKNGKAPAGNPFIIYYNEDMNNLDIEMGFPVGPDVKGQGRVQVSKMPGGKSATAIHIGSYETLAKTYELLAAFVKEQGLTPDSWMWESYLNSPQDTQPERLRTEIVFPLRG